MALADDLVQAVAEAIRKSYDKSVTTAALPVVHATTAEEWLPEARAAVAAVALAFHAAGCEMDDGYCCSVDFRELASAVERGEDGT